MATFKEFAEEYETLRLNMIRAVRPTIDGDAIIQRMKDIHRQIADDLGFELDARGYTPWPEDHDTELSERANEMLEQLREDFRTVMATPMQFAP